MNIRSLTNKATDAQVQAFIEGYGGFPWYEPHHTPEDTRAYLDSFTGSDAGILGVFEDDGDDPYLMAHYRTYRDIGSLVVAEFAGEDAFYVASDPEVIEGALEGHDDICFISNIQANKYVPISSESKPRLRVFPHILSHCFENSGVYSLGYMSHPLTSVSEASVNAELMADYNVERTYYAVEPTTQAHTQMALFVVTQKD